MATEEDFFCELTDDEAHPLKMARVSTPRVMASAERRVGREPL